VTVWTLYYYVLCATYVKDFGVIVQFVDCFRLLYMHTHFDTVLLVFKILNS